MNPVFGDLDALSKFHKLIQWFFTSSVPPWSKRSWQDPPSKTPGIPDILSACVLVGAYSIMRANLLFGSPEGLLGALIFTLSPLLSLPILWLLGAHVSYSAAVSFVAWFCRMAAILIAFITTAGLALSEHACGSVDKWFYSFDLWFLACLGALCSISFVFWHKSHNLSNREGVKALLSFAAVSLLLRFLLFDTGSGPWFNYAAICTDG